MLTSLAPAAFASASSLATGASASSSFHWLIVGPRALQLRQFCRMRQASRCHCHNGHEQFLILEGDLHESDVTLFRAGDMVFYRDGTEHNNYTPNGCLLALHITYTETPVE